jgi:hypothetical protein
MAQLAMKEKIYNQVWRCCKKVEKRIFSTFFRSEIRWQIDQKSVFAAAPKIELL